MKKANEMLWEGVIEKNLDKVRIALNLKAEVNAKDGNGQTPLHVAARNNSLEVAELLISSGAEVNAKDNRGETPLHLAAWNGHQKMKELLQSHGGVR